jgi:uncharacterized protein HemX
MQASVWVPIVVALIAGLSGMAGGWFVTRTQRAATAQEKETREAERVTRELEVAVSGLTSLVNELQEERIYRDEVIRELRAALESCQQQVREIDRALRT